MLSTQMPTAVRHAAPEHAPPATLRAMGIVSALTVAIAIVAIAFALPASRSKPHNVPIGAAGPQAATSQIAERLEQQAPGAFKLTYYPGEAALREAILNRNLYGGIAFGPESPTLRPPPEAARPSPNCSPRSVAASLHTQESPCTPRTLPRPPTRIRAGPGWPPPPCRSHWPAYCLPWPSP